MSQTQVLRCDGSEAICPAEMTPQELGARGEQLAACMLERLGYELVARGWTCPAGEVDLIARDGDTHVLVEVKTRLVPRGFAAVPPELAVDARKQARYRSIARWYLRACGRVVPLRFDVVALSVAADGVVTCRHIEDAVGGDA